MIAPPTFDEVERIAALRRTGLLDSDSEKAYDDITSLAAMICGVPIALVSLIDTERQWFKSKFGIDVAETHRDLAFCAHAILDTVPFEVPDATQDERFKNNPLVTSDPKIRFYAGYPIADTDGHNLGTLCVIDRRPRELTTLQRQTLEVLAKQVSMLIALRDQMRIAETEIARRQRIEAEWSASEQRFRDFMDHSPAAAFIKDARGRYAYVNRVICSRFGIPEQGWLGKTDLELFEPSIALSLQEIDRRVFESGEMLKSVEIAPSAGANTIWRTYKFTITSADGEKYLAGIGVEITAEKESEHALRQSEAKFRLVIERLAEGVYLIDNHTGNIVQVNSALTAMLGYTFEELQNLRARDLFTGEDDGTIRQTKIDADAGLARDGRFDLGRRMYRRKDGSILDVFVQLGHVPQGEAGLTSVIVRDITEQRKYEDRLEEYQTELETANAALQTLATTDGLTGAKNRTAFNKRLEHEIDRTQRYGRPLSLLLLDVDHFKTFNDTYGHPAGDEVLRIVAEILQRAIRETDFAARYGGEEFAVILPETDKANALAIGERCRKMIAETAWPKRPITLSVGISTVSGAWAESSVLLEEADLALYRSKKHGRNRVTQADPPPSSQAIQ